MLSNEDIYHTKAHRTTHGHMIFHHVIVWADESMRR